MDGSSGSVFATPGSTLACALFACLVAGCQSGGANPFAPAASRVPPPATRSFPGSGAPYTNGVNPTGSTAPGAIGTGVPVGAAWSSTPGATTAAGPNTGGVYTSWLERTGSGYSVRTAPASPPAAPPAATGAKPPASTLPPPPTGAYIPPASGAVQPASYETSFPKSTLPADGASSYVAPASSTVPTTELPAPASNSGLIWRTPRS